MGTFEKTFGFLVDLLTANYQNEIHNIKKMNYCLKNVEFQNKKVLTLMHSTALEHLATMHCSLVSVNCSCDSG